MKKSYATSGDGFYMRRALKLAKRGECRVSPNPMVGAVIVRGNRIIGEGYHRCCGEDHAEIMAIKNLTETMNGATVYVTLEPCSHYGKTPPCVNALVAQKPARVVIGTKDPNPLVAGKGIAILKRHGIRTDVGVLENDCRELNERFFKYMQTGRPFVTLKFAQTIDGRIATATGHSRWISSPASLKYAHRLRSSHDAILVGIGTVMQDDPELTVRLVRGRNPLRVVVDPRLRIPMDARVLKDQDKAGTIIIATSSDDEEKLNHIREMGVEIICADADAQGRVDIEKLLSMLGERGISSLLVEGGASVITTFIKKRLVDRLLIVVAPKFVGKGIEAIGDLGIKSMEDARLVSCVKVHKKGDDLIIDGKLK